MPHVELQSVAHFSAWLHDVLLPQVPIGLSLRLSVLPSSASAHDQLVLVRPHVGTELASLLEAQAAQLRAPACGDHHRTGAPAVVDSYAYLLHLLLRVTASAGEGAAPAQVFGVPLSCASPAFAAAAAADGVGRRVLLFAFLLEHSAVWWDGVSSTASATRRSPASLLLLLDVRLPATAVRFADAQQLQYDSDAIKRRTRQRLTRVLRLLSTQGGWSVRVPRLDTAADPSAEQGSADVDWLDYLVERCVEADLRPARDYYALGDASPASASGRAESCTGGAADLPASVVSPLLAAAWHILAAEVEGPVLQSLHRLVRHYITWPFLAATGATDASADVVDAQAACMADSGVVVSYVSGALRSLVRTPVDAFACDITAAVLRGAAASASAGRPPVTGDVAQSCVVPAGLVVLPLAHGSASCSSPFLLRGAPLAVSVDGSVLRWAPLRALLLRVDPDAGTGGWLPGPEAVASQRTYYATYAAQLGDGAPESGEDAYSTWEARGAGKRVVAAARASSQDEGANVDASAAEVCVVALLVSRVLRRGALVSTVAASGEGDRPLWLAALRLFVYALLYGVRVVVTPERLPALVRLFGFRHVPLLHERLCEVHAEGIGEGAPAAVTAAAWRLLEEVCRRPPPLAVYVVDEVALSGFVRLQECCPGVQTSVPVLAPCLPVVLSRDGLRHPHPLHETCSAVAAAAAVVVPCGVCELADCGVVSVDQLSRACTEEALSASMVLSSQAASAAAGTHAPLRRISPACVMARCTASTRAARAQESDAAVQRSVTDVTRCCRVFVASPYEPAPSSASSQAAVGQHTAASTADAKPPRCCVTPTLLLVAPTEVLAEHYGGLLRKTAMALLDALPSLPEETAPQRSAAPRTDVGCCNGSRGSTRTASGGLVRGGGAFFVALARQTQRLLRHLHASTPGGKPLGWGTGLSAADRAAVPVVLLALCEACAALVTRLAEPLMGRPEMRTSFATRGEASPRLRGPRARRGVWIEALRAAVTSSSAPPTHHVLHVYHQSVEEVVAALGSTRGSYSGEEGASATVLELALHHFTADGASHGHMDDGGRDGGGAAAAACYPLWEPLHTNVRAVREALLLLLRTLSAAVD